MITRDHNECFARFRAQNIGGLHDYIYKQQNKAYTNFICEPSAVMVNL